MKVIRSFLLIFFFIGYQQARADKLEKGFERLKIFDYFNAKEYFEKSFKDETAAAAFGLSSIFSSNKNPFYSPDSAQKYILISDSVFKSLKEKTKKYYLKFDVTDSSINKLKEYICEDAFTRSTNENTLEGYNHFLDVFKTCSQFTDVVALRNAEAFRIVQEKNTAASYKAFMSLFPLAAEYNEALNKYEELLYEEQTADKSIRSYEKFIIDYPENPYRKQAERMIFTLTVPDKSVEQYVYYARNYKDTRYTEQAWREIYKLSMKDFSKESYDKFKSDFPDYPYPEEMESDFRLQNYFFLPFSKNDKWGYINELGEIMIKPQFDDATLFSDNLAAVSLNNKYGYTNKAGKIVVDFQFNDAEPFHNDAAIVKKDSLYGLINKYGDYLIDPKYQELSEVSDVIYMAEKNDNAGYLRRNGDTLTGFIFDLAGDFKNGYAIVNLNEKYGLINTDGHFIIEPNFAELVFIGSGLLKALSEKEAWGILNLKGDTILPFLYDVIGEFQEHRALVAIDEKYGYVDEQGIQVIPVKYFYSSIMLTMGQFQEGFAMIKQKYKSVPIDTSGKTISVPGCDDYGRPTEGFIPVRKNKKWGYADLSRKIKIPFKFESAESFKNGLAVIKQNKMDGLIDTTGTIVISPIYEDIDIVENSIVIKSNGKTGLLTRAGILIIPCLYDKIEFISTAIAKATNEKEMIYINLESGKIIFNSSSN